MKKCPNCQSKFLATSRRCPQCGFLLTFSTLQVRTLTGRAALDTFMGLFIGLSLVLTPAFLLYASFKFPVLEKPGWVLIGVTQVAVLIAYITLKNPQPLIAKGFKLVLYFLLAGFVFGGIGACGYYFYNALTAIRSH